MIAPISAKELKELLKRVKLIEVKGMAFTIRKISLLLLLDDPAQIWDWARQGQEALGEKIKALLQNPTLPTMRRVIVTGVLNPKVAEKDADDDSVPVDLILADHELSAGLFIEIVNLSLGG